MALRRNRVPALVGTACLITVGLFAAPAQAAEGNALAEVHSARAFRTSSSTTAGISVTRWR